MKELKKKEFNPDWIKRFERRQGKKETRTWQNDEIENDEPHGV